MPLISHNEVLIEGSFIDF